MIILKIINQSAEVLTPVSGTELLKKIEACGRVCYKSEGNITADSSRPFVQNLIRRGHEAVLEHESITVRFITDRGVSHEIVRHRIASYCQESTRYCNYGKDGFGGEITVIEPFFFDAEPARYEVWKTACLQAEVAYFELLRLGAAPQEARAVLPNSLKTELIMTANMRQWRHFFSLRASAAAHPQMRELALLLLEDLRKQIPVIFDEIDGLKA